MNNESFHHRKKPIGIHLDEITSSWCYLLGETIKKIITKHLGCSKISIFETSIAKKSDEETTIRIHTRKHYSNEFSLIDSRFGIKTSLKPTKSKNKKPISN